MNSEAARTSGIFEAILSYGAENNITLPAVTSPSADRVAHGLFSESPAVSEMSIYHDALGRDMDLYIELVPDNHRQAVRDIVSKILDLNRMWFTQRPEAHSAEK